jgi:hypothetical protein
MPHASTAPSPRTRRARSARRKGNVRAGTIRLLGEAALSAFNLSVASLLGIVVAGALAATALGIAGPSWAVAMLMLGMGIVLGLVVAARDRAHSTVTAPPLAHAETR